MWLISYRRQAVYRTAQGLSRNAPMDAFALTQLHPAIFLARAKDGIQNLEEAGFAPAKGPQSAGDVLRIYSAIDIPDRDIPVGLDAYGDDA